MENNVMHKIKHPIAATLSDKEISEQIHSVLKELESIYSYLIRAKYKNDKLDSWLIEYTVAETDEYNTLKYEDIVNPIVDTIVKSRTEKQVVIGYGQPNLELMTALYTPFVHKLALAQCEKWHQLEYEDAISMCMLTMIKLYRKGYYLHKSLLAKSFNNYILMELRPYKNAPEVISLEQVLYDDGVNDTLSAVDMIPDFEQELKLEQKEEHDAIKTIFDDVKYLLIDIMGERQFEQFYRDYANKHTTPWSRKKMQQVKDKFKKMGISLNSFTDYR